ncbi:MAG: 3-oxoacyl-[acyl-carrier-protein] reductase [bacterium]|nr:3-oxoacyl-[acyl-carrier-protein] reductase [bacterium]
MEGKCVIVTGAGRGIGLEIARTLATQGYDLLLTDVDADGVKAAAAGLEGPGRFEGVGGDVRDFDAVHDLVAKAAEDFGNIYGVVNNAGVTKDTLLVRMSPEDWKFVLDVNLTGTFNFTRAVGPIMMRQREGRMVNIASVIGLSGNAGQANYAASKAGIIALTKSVAKELGGRNVTANAVAPGFIATDMTAELPDKVKAAMLSQIPLKKLGGPGDVAGVVKFLLSPDAAYITGQTLVVDGGMIV